MVALGTCKSKEDQFKMKTLELPQHYSHCKCMFFSRMSSAANSAVRSPIRLNFLVVPVPARMKKIRSKMKALECVQAYMSIFQTLKGS